MASKVNACAEIQLPRRFKLAGSKKRIRGNTKKSAILVEKTFAPKKQLTIVPFIKCGNNQFKNPMEKTR